MDSVIIVDPMEITEHDALASGASSTEEVVGALRGPDDHPVFQIAIRWAGPDPRVALAGDDGLSDGQVPGSQSRQLAQLGAS